MRSRRSRARNRAASGRELARRLVRRSAERGGGSAAHRHGLARRLVRRSAEREGGGAKREGGADKSGASRIGYPDAKTTRNRDRTVPPLCRCRRSTCPAEVAHVRERFHV